MSRIIGRGRYASETYPSTGPQGPQGPQGAVVVNRIDTGNTGGTRLVDQNCAPLLDGTIATVLSVGALFRLIKTPTAQLTAIVNGITVVASTATVGAIWVRLIGTNDERFSANPPAFIDPVLGNDDNDGLSAGAGALKSADEWSRRADGATALASFTVTCAAGDVGSFWGKCYFNGAASVTIRVVGAKTLSTTMTVSAIVAENSAPGVQQEYWLTKTGGPVLTGSERLRILTSAIPNNVNATACVRGFEGGDDTHPYTSTWSNGEITTNNLFAAAGDTFAVETLLTTFRADDVDTRNLNQGCILDFIDMVHPASTSQPGISPNSNNARVTTSGDHRFIGCIFGTTGGSIVRIDVGSLWFRGCEFKTQTHFIAGSPTGCLLYQCTMRVGAVLNSMMGQQGSVFEGVISIGGSGGLSNTTDSLFSRIMAGTAIDISFNGIFATSTGRVWTPLAGARNALAVGINVRAGATLNSSAYATLAASISASVAAIRTDAILVVDEFVVDIESRAWIQSSTPTIGAKIFHRNVVTAPPTSPVSGSYQFAQGGAFHSRSSGGALATEVPTGAGAAGHAALTTARWSGGPTNTVNANTPNIVAANLAVPGLCAAIDNAGFLAIGRLVGRETTTNEVVSAVVARSFRRIAGVLTARGATTIVIPMIGDAALVGAVGALAASGNTIQLNVTGVAATTIAWNGLIELTSGDFLG